MTGFQFPTDGSVLIIDDKIEEALPLIKLLSQKGIAFTFYTGKDPELPEEPTQKIRLAFIDIQLWPGSDSHSYAQNILRLLEKIVPDNNGPYILAIWSKLENVFADDLEGQVTSETFKKRPMIVFRLSKADFFETKVDELLKEDLFNEIDHSLGSRFPEDDITAIKSVIDNKIISGTTFTSKVGALKSISSLLLERLKENDTFQLLALWENLINKASGEIVSSFSALHKTDKYWQENLKSSIYRMAYAQLGKKVDSVSEDELIRNALKTLNQAFLDEIENKISESNNLSGKIKIDRNVISLMKNIDSDEYKISWKVKTEKYKLYHYCPDISQGLTATYEC